MFTIIRAIESFGDDYSTKSNYSSLSDETTLKTYRSTIEKNVDLELINWGVIWKGDNRFIIGNVQNNQTRELGYVQI